MDAAPILIIDDDNDVREVLREVLALEGRPVTEAADGRAGLQQMRAQRPAVVLLDFMMPGMSGGQVVEAMRADPELRDIPVVLVTASQVVLPEVTEYLRKPVDVDALLALVAKYQG